MLDVERLRVMGHLIQQAASTAQIADVLHMPHDDAQNHLTFLKQAGLVHLLNGKYQLDTNALWMLSRTGQRDAYLPAPDLDAKSLKTLAAYLNPDGSIRQLPSSPQKLKTVLHYLVAAFTPEADYTEKEVNTILRRFHLDVAGLRRDMITSGLMARESDGSRYWRTR